ncbi:ferredoxin [Leifsonia sp. Leaf336]|uniref:2Fe-2S iron-sulfur cluster-binding protein n=1 Tax=Leifsonia sp. Leaf336 TaxID=1736341 RepID=UPI0006FB9588|nr:2Fe-2S iron-sulfur cluster-binding protein [Leifsonia sp. Leaf336]KQR53623.1 ferredoxin [Leifsonia sp. Leaf336]
MSPRILYCQPDGSQTQLETDAGTSVMRAAVMTGVPGIVGECGGQAMCATCHVYVRPAWLDRLPGMSEDEDEMLDCTSEERSERSRLGCQIRMSDELSGLEVDVPKSQL